QTCALPIFQPVDLVLQRGHRGISLAAIAVTRFPALEHRGQFMRIPVAECDRGVYGLVQRAMLDGLLTIAMQDGGGKAVGLLVIHVSLSAPGPDSAASA